MTANVRHHSHLTTPQQCTGNLGREARTLGKLKIRKFNFPVK